MSHKQKRSIWKKLRTQLGFEALSMPVNDGGHLGYPASITRKEDIVSVPNWFCIYDLWLCMGRADRCLEGLSLEGGFWL
jgi:hypothetical protein